MHKTLLCSLKLQFAALLITALASNSWSQSGRYKDSAPTATSAAESMLDDAMIHDVNFADADYGWAVGDRGVIWHTSDGGRSWRLQKSTVDTSLRSVQFIDRRNGWAAGGSTDPWLHTSRGVILRTHDGGKSWRRMSEFIMPTVTRIKFFDARRGWAVTRHSEMFPTGVFSTADGGRTWAPVSGNNTASWQTADFFDADAGAAIGPDGSPKVLVRQGVRDSRSPSIGSRRVRSMRLSSDGRGWMVGDRGLILRTSDRGVSWQSPAASISAQLAPLMELTAIAGGGDHVWLAGTPGSRVLYSADAGRTWETFSTGQSLPIAAMHFVDVRRGWAVGALGNILATRDGGRSWRRQRGGGNRAAYLGVFGDTTELPVELVAQLSADEGYLGVMQVVTSKEKLTKHSDTTTAETIAHEAAINSGASAACLAATFPTRPRQLQLSAAKIIEMWQKENDGRALEHLEELLVRRIRMWRPDVVLTSQSSPRGEAPLSHIVNQITLRAIDSAADPTRFVEHTTHVGLESWQAKKVFTALPLGEMGSVSLSTSQLGSRIGKSLSQYASSARALLQIEDSDARETLGFQLITNRLTDAVGRRDFFSGIHLAHGEGARRRLVEPAQNSVTRLRKRAQLERNLKRLLDNDKDRPGDGDRWLAQAGDLTRELEPASAAAVLHRLADRYHKTGRWELAAETMRMIIDRYDREPQAAQAARWLVEYYASSEAAWRSRDKHRFVVRQATAEVPAAEGASVKLAAGEADATTPSKGKVLPQASSNLLRRAGRAAALAAQLGRVKPELFAQPDLRFSVAAAHRHQGYPRQAERYFQTLRHSGRNDAWAASAVSELWLAEAKGVPPLPVWSCRPVSEKPYLDGKLDDMVWKNAVTTPIGATEKREKQTQKQSTTAVAMLAYDEEYLYFAVRCPKVQGIGYQLKNETRTRDSDLTQHDRVELLLDVDRDRRTYYRLAVDNRGFCHDSLWGDATWNPSWYVARGGDEYTWIIEAAIEWKELVESAPGAKHVWAAQIQRITPGVGIQSWSKPASPEGSPEGFGLLVFE